MIIFDEHGFRYTEVGKTLQGKLEERLSFISNTVPRWFTEKLSRSIQEFCPQFQSADHIVRRVRYTASHPVACRIQITPVIQ